MSLSHDSVNMEKFYVSIADMTPEEREAWISRMDGNRPYFRDESSFTTFESIYSLYEPRVLCDKSSYNGKIRVYRDGDQMAFKIYIEYNDKYVELDEIDIYDDQGVTQWNLIGIPEGDNLEEISVPQSCHNKLIGLTKLWLQDYITVVKGMEIFELKDKHPDNQELQKAMTDKYLPYLRVLEEIYANI